MLLMEIININVGDGSDVVNSHSKIHIRLQKRNARKSFTIIEGLKLDVDETTKFLKKMKIMFCCAGYLKNIDEFGGEVIQMSGDNRHKIKDFIIKEYKYNGDDISIHGFE
jgi:translation initiation factor 1